MRVPLSLSDFIVYKMTKSCVQRAGLIEGGATRLLSTENKLLETFHEEDLANFKLRLNHAGILTHIN